MPAITCANVGKRFGRRWVVRGLTCNIRRGESVALFGGNGSGKSTLLRLIATVHALSAGALTVLGEPIGNNRAALRRQIRFLPHEKQLYGMLTVRENLALAAQLRGVAAISQAVESVLERVRLTAAGSRKVAQLSEGMKKRVVLARLLLGVEPPRIVLLDEPHPALDSEGRRILNALITHWRAEGTTLLLASHDHAEILPHVDRVLVLQQGGLTFDGPPRQGQAWS